MASVGRQRFTPQPRHERPRPVARTPSPTRRQPRGEGGLRLQPPRQPRHGAAAALRRPLPLPPAAGHPGADPAAAHAPSRRWPRACRPPTSRATATPGGPYRNNDLSLFLQDEWRIVAASSRSSPACATSGSAGRTTSTRSRTWAARTLTYGYPQRRQQLRAAPRRRLRPRRQRPDARSTPPTASSSTTRSSPSAASRTRSAAAPTACARWSRASPRRWCWRPGARPATAARGDGAGAAGRLVSEPGDLARPRPGDAVRAPGVASASTRRWRELALSANFVWVRGQHQLGTIDYNPVIPSLGAEPPAQRRGRRRGHVRLGAAVHRLRRDLVQGPHASRSASA